MLRSLTTATRRETRSHWARRAAAWERWEPVLLHALSPVNPPLLRALELRPGLRVVDFGCGSGDPALEIAQWVGPRGRVLGVDVSAPMLATARRRARALGTSNVRFRCSDIMSFRNAGPRFDRAVSRFSLMFAGDVPGALERMRAALVPGGCVAIAVWGPLRQNPGTLLREEVVRPYLSEPPEDPERSAHPMRLARRGLLPRLMSRAGFTGVKAVSVRLSWVYPSVDDYVRMQIDTTLAELYGSLPPARRARLRAGLRRTFRRFASDGALRYPARAWVVSARRG